MSTVLRFTSHYVAGQIEAQYAKGIEMASKYRFDHNEEVSKTFIAQTGNSIGRQFADLMIKDGEEICQLALQKLDKLLLDDALGVY
ncbi:hypothetical protein L915_14023 [Phytophthora nicotianae]|nr:hypothetical protein L915_14023 [Phytophthora nicotianae]